MKPFALVVVLWSGCTDEACRWQTGETKEVSAESWTIEGAVHPITELGLTTRADRFGGVEQLVYITLAQEPHFVIDVTLEQIVLGANDIDPAHATLKAYREPYEVVWTMPISGQLTVSSLSEPHCQQSSEPDNHGWACAIDLAGALALDAGADRRYQLSLQFEVDQELTSQCYQCDGIEGCDY